jgi:spermidine synthase
MVTSPASFLTSNDLQNDAALVLVPARVQIERSCKAGPVVKQRIELVRDADRKNSYLLSVEGVAQSYVDLDDPTNLELEYVALFADVLDAYFEEGRRLDVVHLGAGACTLARYIAATRPGSKQKAYDTDDEVVRIVLVHLGVGDVDGLTLIVQDARTAVAQMRDASAHCIVTDVYVGPRATVDVLSLEAMTDVRRVLRPRGLYLINVADRAPFAFAKPVLATVQRVFEHVAILADPGALRGRRYGNIVVAAARRPLPIDELTRRAARALPPARLVSADRLDALVGDAQPVTDAAQVEPPILRSWIYDRSNESE